MKNDRINKFIFSKHQFFLRLKTTAKNIKIKKVERAPEEESEYKIELLTYVPKRMLTLVPVVVAENFLGEVTIHKDALALGHEKDKTGIESTANIANVEEPWGERLAIRTPDKHATYYYLVPSKEKLDVGNVAVKFGPIFKSIDDKELQIDWTHIQWGNI